MRFSLNILKDYLPLEGDLAQIRTLLEDIGLEVKKIENENGDSLITFEFLANRGDHHCYEGIAREISGRTLNLIQTPSYDKVTFNPNPTFFSIETDDCIAYALAKFKKNPSSREKTLPKKYMQMLEVGGVNQILPVIDVTNVINLELGQPAHVYDADKIKGKICIRASRAGEIANLLFSKNPITLPAGITVIADEEKILTIAGIIGCNGASVEENTSSFLLETALFDPVKIRKTSKLLAIQTLASQRFERGGDLNVVKRAVERAVHLYSLLNWELEALPQFKQRIQLPNRSLSITTTASSEYLDYPFSTEEILERLARYGFSGEKIGDELHFKVPMNRIWDVTSCFDLYEELAKSVGYNNLPNLLPNASLGNIPTEAERNKELINHYLVDEGFFEVFTDSLYSNLHQEKMGLANDRLNQHVTITNAEDKGYSLLKNNCLIQGVELVENNLRLKTKDIKAYEWTRVFIPNKNAPNGVCDEQKILWGIVNGGVFPKHFSFPRMLTSPLYLKGLIESIAAKLDINLVLSTELDESKIPLAKLLHPLRRMGILDSKKNFIGLLGEVHPNLLLAFDIKDERPCYFQLDSERLLALPKIKLIYKPPYDTMSITRDICITVQERYPAGEVISFIKNQFGKYIEFVKLTDIYVESGNNRKITYSIVYRPQEGCRSVEEVNQLTDKIRIAVENSLKQ